MYQGLSTSGVMMKGEEGASEAGGWPGMRYENLSRIYVGDGLIQ